MIFLFPKNKSKNDVVWAAVGSSVLSAAVFVDLSTGCIKPKKFLLIDHVIDN